jgi:hypothetical protein
MRASTQRAPIFKNTLHDFKGHRVVNHSKYEYTRVNPYGSVAGINYCGNFFPLLKRAHCGMVEDESDTAKKERSTE